MPGWGNPHEWPQAAPAQADARQLILDLAAVHGLLAAIGPWATGSDERRKLAFAKVAAAQERLIDLVGQS